MSEQSKSNVQALGAGLLGFVAVVAVGAGVLMFHSSQQSKAGAKPEAAAAPIDIGSSMPRPSMTAVPAARERRGDSPAPLIGYDNEDDVSSDGSEASAGSGSAPQAAASAGSPAPRLEVTQHLDKPGNGSSATAIVQNTIAPEKAAKRAPKKAVAKLDPTGGGSAAIASVHYGVTSRSELMGRAAGPVYNFKGKGGGGSAPTGKMAESVDAKIADLRRKLETAEMPADQRAKLLKELEDATKGLPSAGTDAQ